MEKLSREHHSRSPPDKGRGQNSHRFKGVRLRKWGRWGSEIRMPKTRAKIWLGSYEKAEQAARAYDAAVYCLRGPNAKFNFPDSVPSIPSAFSLSPRQIQVAAGKYARDELPSTSHAPDNNNNNNCVSLASQLKSPLVSETELGSNSEPISEERDFWVSLLDTNECLEFPNYPFIDDTCALDFIPPWQDEPDEYISLDLWSF